jgi:hypothetical protein
MVARRPDPSYQLSDRDAIDIAALRRERQRDSGNFDSIGPSVVAPAARRRRFGGSLDFLYGFLSGFFFGIFGILLVFCLSQLKERENIRKGACIGFAFKLIFALAIQKDQPSNLYQQMQHNSTNNGL